MIIDATNWQRPNVSRTRGPKVIILKNKYVFSCQNTTDPVHRIPAPRDMAMVLSRHINVYQERAVFKHGLMKCRG